MGINVVSADDFAAVSAKMVGFAIIELQKKLKRNVNLVLATGHTMVGFLDELSKVKGIDWKRVNAFHLDEYKGLDIEHPCSYAYFLTENLFSKVDIPEKNIHLISEIGKKDYMNILRRKGRADITMLGIGMDGHLAFNEPPNYSGFDSKMQEVKLTKETIDSNIDLYPEIKENPYAITMGMADIMESKKLFFLANKAKKAHIVKKALTGPVTEEVPASILQKHENVEIILDKAAGALVK